MMDCLVDLELVVARESYGLQLWAPGRPAALLVPQKDEADGSPAIAAFSSGSCKISSGIWFATRLIGVDLGFGFDVPTNRFRGFDGPATGGVSIPSAALFMLG
jgi:hypothetical protein